MSRAIASALILLGLACPAAVAHEKKADAILILSQGHVAAGVGYRWANGTLTYRGQTFPVKVEGLSVGEVGVIRVKNPHGVLIEMESITQGISLKRAAEGITLSIRE